MKILIAEDEPISRLALEATVPQWGFVPITVANGQEALERLTARNDPPPIAILDWMMPGLDGADVYVRKPFDRIELQARLQVGMRVIKLQQQLLDRVRELEEGHERERALRRLLPDCAHKVEEELAAIRDAMKRE